MIAGSRIFLCLNFMVDLCKAKPCLNQFINQTRSSSLSLHLFSAVTFHKIESRCLHSGGTMLFCSVWWSKYWILSREAFWINNTLLLFIFLQYIHFFYHKSCMHVKRTYHSVQKTPPSSFPFGPFIRWEQQWARPGEHFLRWPHFWRYLGDNKSVRW